MARFLPLAHDLAAFLTGVEPEDMANDPAAAVHAMSSTTSLFGWPLVLTHFRVGGEAKGFPTGVVGHELYDGVTESVANEIIITRGLRGALSSEVEVVAMVTGPRTLGALLPIGPHLASVYTHLIRAYVEAGADRLLMVEKVEPNAPGASSDEIGTLRSVIGTANYFRCPMMMLDLSGHDLGDYEEIDLVFGRQGMVLLPAAAFRSPVDASVDIPPKTLFVTTDAQLPADCDSALVEDWTRYLSTETPSQ